MINTISQALLQVRYNWFPQWKTLKKKQDYWHYKLDGRTYWGYTTYKIKYSKVREEYKLDIDGRKPIKGSETLKNMLNNLSVLKNRDKKNKLIEK